MAIDQTVKEYGIMAHFHRTRGIVRNVTTAWWSLRLHVFVYSAYVMIVCMKLDKFSCKNVERKRVIVTKSWRWTRCCHGCFKIFHNHWGNFKANTPTLGLFLLVTIAFLTGHLVARYVRSFASLALFTGSLTHFAHSLVGQYKFKNMCSRWKRVSWEQSRFLLSVETHPF